MVFALCFGQPRKKRGGKLSIGRATVTANLELATEKKLSVAWTARKKAVKKKLQSSTAKQSHARCKPPKQPLTGNCASKVKNAFPPGRVTAVKKNTNPDPGPRGQLHLSCRVHSANWQPALPAPLPSFSTCVYSALTARKFLFSTRSHTD